MRENTHVAEDYAQRLMESYDKLMVARYVRGEFISIKAGRALHAFSRMRHVKKNIEKHIHVDPRSGHETASPVWVTMDFNVDPMTAVLWNRGTPYDKFFLRAYDEIWLPDSNTPAMLKELTSRLNRDDDVTIYPDPTGNSRSTSAMKSDIQHIKDGGFYKGFYKVKMKRRIMSVRDCLNAANGLLDKNKVQVSYRCKKFISDCEQTIMKGSELDKSKPNRTHMVDGYKNMADYEFPVVPSYTKYRTQRMR